MCLFLVFLMLGVCAVGCLLGLLKCVEDFCGFRVVFVLWGLDNYCLMVGCLLCVLGSLVGSFCLCG